MTTIDYKEIRDSIIQLHGLKNIDKRYIFYHDETNNIRKFYLKEEGYNQPTDLNFVLGGICFQQSSANLQELFDALKLDKSTKEVKLKNIAQGNFEDCLKSPKLTTFLNWLYESDLFTHFSVLNIFYYALVDIVDSALAKMEEMIPYEQLLKSVLYEVVKRNHEEAHTLFIDCNYPNIPPEKVNTFIDGLLSMIQNDEHEEDAHMEFGKDALMQLLVSARQHGMLVFVQDNEDRILQENFLPFYLHQIFLFYASSHIFDKEDTIQLLIEEYEILYGGNILTNYTFHESKDDMYLQVSDIFTGLMGKYCYFVHTKTMEEIEEALEGFNKFQIANLKTILKLQDKSEKENKAFIHATVSMHEQMKYGFINNYMSYK